MSDDELVPRRRLYSFAVLMLIMLMLGGANLLFTSREVNALRTAVRTQCEFYDRIGGAPLKTGPGARKAGELGVRIIADARLAWHGLGCPGRLEPAAPSFRRWAAFYHIRFR